MVGPFTPMIPTTIPMAGLFVPSIGLGQGMRSTGPWMRPSGPWMGHPGPRMEFEPWNVPHRSSFGYPGQPMGYPGPGIGMGNPGPRMGFGPWNVPHGSSLGYPGLGIGMGHPGPYTGHTRGNTGFLRSGSGMRSRGMSPPPLQVKKKKEPEVTEEKKPELKGEQKLESEGEQNPESEGEQKQVTKSRPVASTPIPGTVWCVVQTNDGRHFFYDPSKRRSVWKMPEELKNNPDVDKLLSSKPEVKADQLKREEKDVQEEPPAKKFKSEVEVKETKEESTKEGAQETVLKQETANTVQVDAADIPFEDRVKQFKELLAEKNVCVPSKWEWELAKVAYDKRYSLLPSQKRRQAYYDFMRERAEEMRIDHIRRASEAKKLYRELLEESNLNMKSTFRDFTINHSSDSRFRMITSLCKRHSMFLDYIKEKEKEQSVREKLKNDFMNMLSETPGITRGSKWKLVKGTLSSDPRFQAEAETRRASWFQLYLKSENFEKKDFLKMLSETPGINESTSWGDVQKKVSSEPRYKAVVSDFDRENWFGKHLNIVKDKKKDFLKMLSEIPGINDSAYWIDVRNKVSSDLRYMAVVRYSDREDLIRTYLKTIKDKKNDFLKMLSEIPGINDSTSWSDVKIKVSSDPRYKAVVSDSDQEDYFITYLKTVKEKKNDFLKMLSEIPGINDSTSWSDVEKKVSSDSRYKAVVSDSDREDWFGTYLKTVKEKKDDFLKMLSEIPGINDSPSWSDVKIKVRSDPRYKAVVRYSDQKDYFRTYLKTLKDATSDDIRNKAEQCKNVPLSSVKETDESEKSHREAATEDFKHFLVEKVKHSEGSFESFKSRFDRNPRWTVELTDAEKKILYDSHVGERNKQILHKTEVKENFKKMLSVIPGINRSSSWREVKSKVSSDPCYKAVASDSRREDWFRTFVKTLKDVPYDDIRNKKQQIKSFHSSSLKEKDDSSMSHREAAEKDFIKFLAEKVNNCESSFESFKSRFDADPRWAEELTDADKKKLYDSQVEEIKKQNLELLWSVLDEIENERNAGAGKNLSENP